MSSPQPPPFSQSPATPPPERRATGQDGIVRRITLAVVLFLLAGVMIMVWNTQQSSPDAATTGDCVSRAGAGDDIKVVACTDSTATEKVVGRVENTTQVQFSINSRQVCKSFPTARTGFWKGEPGKAGYVLCLAPAK